MSEKQENGIMGTKIAYNPNSMKAEEFINHQEILDTIAFAEANANNEALALEILEKARDMKGLSHRDATVLLASNSTKVWEEIFKVVEKIKEAFYGRRIVLFAPIYLSNYCINGCVYCPFHAKNKHIARRQLSQAEIVKEVTALQDMGHKRLALETGEDPKRCPLSYVLESLNTIYSIKHKNGAIRRVNVNIAAPNVDDLKQLKKAGIGTYILFQETYDKERYEKLHPYGPKHNYAWHTEAHDRAQAAGCDDVGLGVLFGLSTYMYEFVGLMMHAEHLEAVWGVGPHTVSFPRIRPADDINPQAFENALQDDIFVKLVALVRLSMPYTGMIISTRESKECRAKLLKCGISQISGASCTAVGGYACGGEDTEQFDVSDTRSLDEVVRWLLETKHIPSFCTACYRSGRTGDRFMSLCKSRQIHNCCQPNALLTLKEYLLDYASAETVKVGEEMIQQELERIPNPKIKAKCIEYLALLEQGKRDLYF